jgi:hypothetical protein
MWAINKVIRNINQNNQLQILNLEKQATHQKQLALKILDQLKFQKNSKRGQYGSLTSQQDNRNPFQQVTSGMIDLTLTQSQSPIKNQTFGATLEKWKHIHWEGTQTQTRTYYPTHTHQPTGLHSPKC